jgi:hypothetical protein
VAPKATPKSVDQGTTPVFEHDWAAESATMAIPAKHDASVPVGAPADARAAPVAQRSGLRVDLAQSGRDDPSIEGYGLAIDRAQAELISRILRRELHFACFSVRKLSFVGPETGLLGGLLAERKGMQFVPPRRCGLGRDAFAGTQPDAERAVRVDMPLGAARGQSRAALALEPADVVAEVQQLELEEPGEGLAGAYRNDVDVRLATVYRPEFRPCRTALCERGERHDRRSSLR